SKPQQPDGLVELVWDRKKLKFWPYTGTNFNGNPQDPINLVFVGRADPTEIRAALLALDGDRTAFGFPPVFPFNATWSDAIGNVQTGYAKGEGWIGGVVQLQLGAYSPVRFHLRLFRAEKRFGKRGEWTLGNAHFEITIPGTAEHQVVCWELAERIVVADLIRSGLLDPKRPPASTGVINQAPTYREIPVPIYNGMPEALKVACGLPPGAVTAPVPIPSDGEGTVLHLAKKTRVRAERITEEFTVQFSQFIPMPFCSEGPLDFVFAEGTLDLRKTVRVKKSGHYEYDSNIAGILTVTPVDITQFPPVPIGDPFLATVRDKQKGNLDRKNARVTFDIERIAPQASGTESLEVKLKVGTRGKKTFRSEATCITPGP
ncbi:MAG: hypothetical protein O7D32_05165, partial [bacterium]|nr:hypothetical protein [bacterium]